VGWRERANVGQLDVDPKSGSIAGARKNAKLLDEIQ
jgi:hypothetical protein